MKRQHRCKERAWRAGETSNSAIYNINLYAMVRLILSCFESSTCFFFYLRLLRVSFGRNSLEIYLSFFSSLLRFSFSFLLSSSSAPWPVSLSLSCVMILRHCSILCACRGSFRRRQHSVSFSSSKQHGAHVYVRVLVTTMQAAAARVSVWLPIMTQHARHAFASEKIVLINTFCEKERNSIRF